MALNPTDTYTDIATADTYLATKNAWLSVSDEKKQEALLEARFFIDQNWYIDDVSSVANLANVPDELQYANSLLALDFINDGDLFSRDKSKTITEQSVKAGPVVSSKKFLPSKADKLPASYPKVKVLLAPLYQDIDGMVHLMRG